MLSMRSAATRAIRGPIAARATQWTARAALTTDAATAVPAAAAASAASAPPSTTAPSARRSSSADRPSVKDASSESAQRSFALRLYKALLRSHRAVLPDAMRSLGDAYVREEFKLHKSAKPQHLHGFFTQWIQYLDQMRSQSPGQWGQPMTPELLSSLNDEQRKQLELLQKSAAKLDAQWSGMEKDQNPVTQQ